MRKLTVIRQSQHCESEFEYDCWNAGLESIKEQTGLVATRYCPKEKRAYVYFKDIPGELSKGQQRGTITLFD